jgi:hypothetical protein
LIARRRIAVFAWAQNLLLASRMKKPTLAANASHPIHQALVDLHGLVRKWLAPLESADASRMRRATARAMGAVRIAATGSRRFHHLRLAWESLLWVQNGFDVLLGDAQVSDKTFDKARRHLHRVLVCLERLMATDEDSWSTVELPAIEKRPENLAEEPTIKRLRRLPSWVEKTPPSVTGANQPDSGVPDTPKKDAA